MQKRWLAALIAVLVLTATTVSAQDVRESDAMRRAFDRAGLYAQGFEVRFSAEKSPGQAVPLLRKAGNLAQTLPDGQFLTEETAETTVLILSCRVAPTRAAVQDALSRMRRVLGADGEIALMLYGLAQDAADVAEPPLRALLETLGDGVRSTRKGEDQLVLLGAAYQAAAKTDGARVRIALARPRFWASP